MTKYINAPMDIETLCRGAIRRMNFTESVYHKMQNQFSELRFGKPDLEFDEMWKFIDQLQPKITYIEEKTLLLPSHLYHNLKKTGYNVFYQLPKDFCQEYITNV